MARAQWIVAALTVTLLCTGVALLHGSEGAEPAAPGAADALPSRALGLSGHRRLVHGLEHSGAHGPGHTPRKVSVPPLRASRPLRLRIPGLGVDLPLERAPQGTPGTQGTQGTPGTPGTPGAAGWDPGAPVPGTAGTAVITADGLPLGRLRRGRTIEIPRADHRTAVFTVERVSPGGVDSSAERPGRARLRLVSGETVVLARLTGPLRGGGGPDGS
ncbi:class F sortase [Streptomyces sp. NPDC002033]|uniref:class F sortase n=1 Tax=unclassified Streptomyces TaxID=2593676 RepID=UPI00331CA841